MDFHRYQDEAARTMPSDASDRDRLLIGALGLAGESGEVVDLIKKHAYHGHEIDHEKIAKELGDVLWYLAAIATAIDWDLAAVATLNIQKLRVRYPDGFSSEASLNRADD